MNKPLLLILTSIVIISSTEVSCNKQLDAVKPYNQVSQETQLSTKAGILEATRGNYLDFYTQTDQTASAFLNYFYYWHNLAEFRGNNVVLSAPINEGGAFGGGNLIRDNDAYFFLNSGNPNNGISYSFWRKSYIIIAACNAILSKIGPNTADTDLQHAQGQNLFLRAYLDFNLLRIYGRPYYQSPQTNLGIVLDSTDVIQKQKRATVAESYNFIINDLIQAAALLPSMTSMPSNSFNIYATKEAAWAFLSRVYLYMGGSVDNPNPQYNSLSIQYADSVISSPNFTLATTSELPNIFNTNDATTLPEVIFAFNMNSPQLNPICGYYSPGIPAAGLAPGGVNASPDYLSLLDSSDVRSQFISNGNVVTKWSYQALNTFYFYTNTPLIVFRLAEMYLNRAEAEAKIGDDGDALTDLNIIHTRAGLQPYSGLTGTDLTMAILKERRIELAFEGQNSFDYFRNGLPMIRNYASYNSGPLTIQPTDNRVVMQIPDFEIQANPLLIQNAQ